MATTVAERERAMEQLQRSFKGVMAAVRRLRGRETHRAGELGHSHYSLLFELEHCGELPAGELALAAEVSPATVTGIIDVLEGAGLVERVRHEQDRRVVVVRLTPSGRQRVAARRAQIDPLWQGALADFGPAELAGAAAVLDRLRWVFEELAED